ncbi:MAG: zinc ribbon domain-containing protein [Chlorobi bacterium]|nr:zinc ribbon domain-containing protein [Chlorobiota bacterium]MCI0717217.1 zinc ribbon domain-containing protein [Chlorobiota bacterium]
MPIYEYQCSNCGHKLDELQRISEPPLTKCPNCRKDTLKRLIGSGAGLIFKGSGFYLTDYKKSSSQKDKSKGETASKTETNTERKTAAEAKPSTKEESKKN